MIFVFAFFLLIYALLIFLFILGLTKIKRNYLISVTELPFLTVVVACRNESNNLKHLAKTLINQNYPIEKFEIILVNDHSIDTTADVLRDIEKSDNRFRILHLTSNCFGKKAALRKGIEHAQGDIIAVTDADCRIPSNWLSGIANSFANKQIKLLLGAVKMESKNFFESLQALEFNSLIGSSMGAAMMGFPFLANGANMAFRKTSFLETDIKPNIASGDDIFLLQGIKSKYGASAITFLTDPSTVILTKPKKTLQAFLLQRLRWLSKSKGYSDPQIIFIGIIIFTTNILLLIGCLFFCSLWPYFLAGLVAKFSVDFILLFFSSRFLRQKSLLIYSFPLLIIYPFYLFLVSLLALFKTPEWKARKI